MATTLASRVQDWRSTIPQNEGAVQHDPDAHR
jgi:hypothetical protein